MEGVRLRAGGPWEGETPREAVASGTNALEGERMHVEADAPHCAGRK